MVSFHHNELLINNKRILLPLPISKTLEIDNKIIVILERAVKGNLPNNIFAYDKNGLLNWAIHDPHVRVPGGHDSYTNVWVEEGKLLASNTVGFDYLINLKSGEVTLLGPHKPAR